MRNEAVTMKLMIMDACVLIDFVKTDPSVLALIADCVGPIHVISAVIEEVNEIQAEDDLTALGLTVVAPEIEDVFAAASGSGPASFQDRLCLLTAKRHGFHCVTNDINFRKSCKAEGVPLLWGLELLAELHKAGGISGKNAEQVAQAIRKSNPKHITAKIITDFLEIVRRQETQSIRHNPGNQQK